jgi:hypothetical protein
MLSLKSGHICGIQIHCYDKNLWSLSKICVLKVLNCSNPLKWCPMSASTLPKIKKFLPQRKIWCVTQPIAVILFDIPH